MRRLRILGAVALIAALAGAQAADLKRVDAASMPALDVCPNGGIRLAGSDACLRLGGRVRAETTVSSGSAFRSTLTRGRGTTAGLRTVGTVSADVRVPTELGPVRTYLELRSAAGRAGR